MNKFYILIAGLILLPINFAYATMENISDQEFKVYMTNNSNFDGQLNITPDSINPTFALKPSIARKTENVLIGQGTILTTPGKSWISFSVNLGAGDVAVVNYFPPTKDQYILQVKPNYLTVNGEKYCARIYLKDEYSMFLDIEPIASVLCSQMN